MKILFTLSRFPYPLEKGDKLRAYYQIKNLSAHHEVVVFALSDKTITADELKQVEKICKKAEVFHLSRFSILINLFKALFGKLPLQVAYFYSSKAKKQLDELIKNDKPDHIFCQLVRTAEYVKDNESIPKTLDYMDVFSKGVERRISTAPFYLRPIYKMEYKRLSAYEENVFTRFKNKIIISKQDRDLIPHPQKESIVVISNGVDTDYFKPSPNPSPNLSPKGERFKEFDILFSGNMNYPPNIESAEYLVGKILPLVKKKYPNVKVLISGANPSQRILSLASDNVKISGWVNDIRENFACSKMLVAPMFLSIGLQNKLLEAMAMQIPCITSTLANNALGAE
ncbi:MAG TPA: glycosyltransferase, partial [Bacteroidia bacterium]|nr:glycosyltransferase [Bacteroidia bacterium]